MILWLGFAAGLFTLLLVVAVRVPVSLCSNVQAKADPSGAWAVVCGLALGPFAFSAVAARGVKPFLTCHLFGKRLLRVPLSRWTRRHSSSTATVQTELGGDATEPLSRVERGLAAVFRSLDPLEILLSWPEKARLFQVRSLLIELDYSFRDVALTGRILAALYVLSGVLPERCEIRQTPGWESEDRVAFGADGHFRIWPGRLLFDVARFVLKQRSKARQGARPAKRATHST